MSDVSQGAGWWKASDGKWYPPEQHPSYQPPQATNPQSANQPRQVASPPLASQPPQAASSEKALEAKGFIRSLYDFSFSSLITLRVIRFLYVLITILYSLGALIGFVVLLSRHTTVDVVLAIVVVPIGYLIYLIIARISLEILMVVFNIGKDVRAIRERGAVST